ncbi:MAG: hypothetical protein HY067_01395 [Betaproteobacteria bacterium]|nr:hypothetical protein [Betaproteobacteria bacterium]
MKLHGWIAWILLALLGACASQPKEPPRIMMDGFSIAPPNEKEWIIAKQSPDVTVIGKPGRFSGETFTMQATIIKLPPAESTDELVRHVESTQRKELDPKRYRVFKLEVGQQKIHGQACALSRVEAAERTTTDGTGSPVNMMLETLTLICPHPKDSLRGINMAYSHRHFPEDVDPQFSQDAAMLMQNLAFEPL